MSLVESRRADGLAAVHAPQCAPILNTSAVAVLARIIHRACDAARQDGEAARRTADEYNL
jgi:hypothetical protein